MSRYRVDLSVLGELEIAVGWDNPLDTFFFQVFSSRADVPLLHLGNRPHQYTDIVIFRETLEMYGIDLDTEVILQLKADKEKSGPLTEMQSYILDSIERALDSGGVYDFEILVEG